jgi:hypothetical protein
MPSRAISSLWFLFLRAGVSVVIIISIHDLPKH